MDREQKRTEVAQLRTAFTAAKSAVVLEFKGLSVEKDTAFRRSIRESRGKYRVSKNTLLKLAVKDTPFESLSSHFKGSTAVATTENDVIALAKAIQTFLKDNPAATFKGAILDGKTVSVAEFQMIADLPTRDVLISKLLFLMQYPVSGLAVTLDQIRMQKEGAA